MLDFNDAEPQRSGDLISPCYAKVKGVIRPGGLDGFASGDEGLLKASNSSDALMLDWEFTVMHGPNAGRKVFVNMTVHGGNLDEKGVSKGWKMSKSSLRAMAESALGVRPDDTSDAAKSKRMFANFQQLNGIEFAAHIDIEKGKEKPDKSGYYDDKNVIKTVITPDRPEWSPLMNGQDVPMPVKAAAGPAQAAKPAWGGGAAASPPQQAKPAAGPAWGGGGAAKAPAPASAPPQQAAAQTQQQAAPAKTAGPAWLNG